MGRDHVRDDAGGVWIKTAWVLGLLVYAGVLVTWHAGFTAATPFVVIPPVLIIMIGAGNLLSGRSNRRAPQFNRPDPVPLPPLRGPAAPPPSASVPTAGPEAPEGSDDAPAGGPGPGR
jgi:hypothetical protein